MYAGLLLPPRSYDGMVRTLGLLMRRFARTCVEKASRLVVPVRAKAAVPVAVPASRVDYDQLVRSINATLAASDPMLYLRVCDCPSVAAVDGNSVWRVQAMSLLTEEPAARLLVWPDKQTFIIEH